MLKKILIIMLLLPVLSLNSQKNINSFNGFKYIIIPKIKYSSGYDIYDIQKNSQSFFQSKGFIIINDNNFENFYLNTKNFCELLTIEITHDKNYNIFFKAIDCKGKIVYSDKGDMGLLGIGLSIISATNDKTDELTHKEKFAFSWDRIRRRIKNISINNFNPNLTPTLNIWGSNYDYKSENYEGFDFNFNDEKSIRTHLDINRLNPIEGIWKYSEKNNEYELLILKNKKDENFSIYILNSLRPWWKNGELKGELKPTASNNFWEITWTYFNKIKKEKSMGQLTNGVFSFNLPSSENGIGMLYKYYPRNSIITNPIDPNDKIWRGNGSGIIISSTGYIVTNNHVIDNRNEIEVEFVINGQSNKYNSKLIIKDEVNDLAIIKIIDENFNKIENINYNLKTKTSEVGTKVYAFGYPKALNLMGKEIKVTDGIISSKSGFRGDITTYQITAPIQGGNSGGPLFDEDGNLIGINSAKLSDKSIDNVAYSIKSNYILNLIDLLPESLDLPSNMKLKSQPFIDQVKEISKYVVLIKVR